MPAAAMAPRRAAVPPLEVGALLRAELLEGTSIVVAATRGAPTGAAVAEACAALGASVAPWAVEAKEWQEEGEGAAGGAAPDAAGDADLLAMDAASVFAVAGAGREGLRLSLEVAWGVTKAVAERAFLPVSGADGARGGRIVYIAPAPRDGAHAEAARAGLENLSRTLSIEWARHQTTTVTIAPGDDTAAQEVATLVAYLASPAGAYFSGCLLDLRGVRADG